MANNSATQQALADDRRFQDRLENALGKVAWEVLGEDPLTVHHAERAAYANRVLSSPQQVASQLASSFVGRPNVFGFETSYDFTVGGVVTAAGDADIESQLHTDWNQLAGVVA
jgi:hypothetical protein